MDTIGESASSKNKFPEIQQQANVATFDVKKFFSEQNSNQQSLEKLSRPAAFDKMEALLKDMQDTENGVPVRQQKLFLTSIPYAFMGYDLIEWLMDKLSIEEAEALSIANQLCLHGYFFPVNDTKTLMVKDDSSLYRFQTPYYWPWQHKVPDNVEYAIYLCKRSLRNKQRHGLEDYENEALLSLHRNLKGKWDIISMQAEEQVRLSKERKKGDKIVSDSQERAYWRVHRPPPGQFTPLECCPVPSRDRQGSKPRKRLFEDSKREVEFLEKTLNRTRMKMSQVCESLLNYWETFVEYDFFLKPALPSNPWVSDDTTFWQLNNAIVDVPTEKRVKRWSISIEELVSDPKGLQEFTTFLEKEYSHENIRFWIAVNRLRRAAYSQVPKVVNEIYEEFLKPGAPCEINIDSQTMEAVQKDVEHPSRFAFDAAAEHVYALLLKKDCYPRFIRSDHYKSLLACGIQPSHKKRFFAFGGVTKKKISTNNPPTQIIICQTSSSVSTSALGSLPRRRGSERSLTGSTHDLEVLSGEDSINKLHPTQSQTNLCEISHRCGDLQSMSPTNIVTSISKTQSTAGSNSGEQESPLTSDFNFKTEVLAEALSSESKLTRTEEVENARSKSNPTDFQNNNTSIKNNENESLVSSLHRIKLTQNISSEMGSGRRDDCTKHEEGTHELISCKKDVNKKVVIAEYEQTAIQIANTLTGLTEEVDEIFCPREGGKADKEYRECAQFISHADIHDDKINIETHVSLDYVPPAPASTPSIAPLAEIETDQIEEEQQFSEIKLERQDTKKKRKKKESDLKQITEKISVSQSRLGDDNHNAVCPWEDENVDSSDTTFVKTYATLGYL